MKFQEAKNIKVGDTVFIINSENRVFSKRVIGLSLRKGRQIDITHINHTQNDLAKGYILPHEDVFLKEKHALRYILEGIESQVTDIKVKGLVIRDRIKTLEREEERKHTDNFREAT